MLFYFPSVEGEILFWSLIGVKWLNDGNRKFLFLLFSVLYALQPGESHHRGFKGIL